MTKPNSRLLRAALATLLGATLATVSASGAWAAPKPRYPVDAPSAKAKARAKHGEKPAPSKTAGKHAGQKGDTHPAARHEKDRHAEARHEGGKHAPAKHAESKHAESRHAEAARGGSYTVGHGDTLTSLARKFGVSQHDLAEENGVDARHGLRAGQKLRVPHGGGDKPLTRAEKRQEAREVAQDGHGHGKKPHEGGDYTVARGDTLSSISRRTGVPQAEIAAANEVSAHSLRAGMRLHIPGAREVTEEEAPRGRHEEVAREETRGATSYRVARGDTVDKVARHFGLTSRALRQANGLASDEPLERGQKLKIPGTTRMAAAEKPPRRVHTVEPYVAPPVETARQETHTPEPYRSPVQTPDQPARMPEPEVIKPGVIKPGVIPPTLRAANDHTPVQAIHSTPPSRGFPSADQLTDLGRGRFVWPVKGEVLSRYGAVGHDLKNDGLNIAADAGASVRSAAEGEVVYAGDSVPGFGNLVLIKHTDGWVTAYGHLAKIGVRMRQHVAQGEEIGQVGVSGGVDRPQLHFEVRYAPNAHEKARPVDPSLLLP